MSIASTRTVSRSAGADKRERHKFWEIWDKLSRRGGLLHTAARTSSDETDPHLDLRNFFPVPEVGFTARCSARLVPVP